VFTAFLKIYSVFWAGLSRLMFSEIKRNTGERDRLILALILNFSATPASRSEKKKGKKRYPFQVCGVRIKRK